MMKTKFYSFSGRDEEGRLIRGTIDSTRKSLARLTLLKIGLTKINYITASIYSYKKLFFLKDKEKLHALSQISLQINSGISIIDSVNSMKLDSNSFKLKYLFFIVAKNLSEGRRFSEALDKIPYSSFSKTEIGLIKSSEVSGTLDASLTFICERLQKNIFIKQKLVSASIYPCMTIGISFAVTFIIFKWIIPQFETIFHQNKHALPFLTEFVFSISDHLGKILLSMLIMIIFLIIAAKQLIKYQALSDKRIETIHLRIPILGKIRLFTNKVNFCYTLSMLLNAGIPINKALIEASENITLKYSKHCLQQATAEVIAGRKLSSALKKTHFLPRAATQTIVTAEKTGRLDHAFETLGQQFSNEFSVFSDQIEKIIEPIIITALGGVIGLIVIAIYLPIFQLGSLY